MPNTPNIAQYNIVCLQKNIKLQGKNLIGKTERSVELYNACNSWEIFYASKKKQLY